MTQPHAIIAGAGIGGLSASLALARIGWRVTLLERSPVLEEVGAGLQLSPNASTILRDWGILDKLGRNALEPEAIRIRRAKDGAILTHIALDDARARWGAPYLTAHRADLQRALMEKVADVLAISLRTNMNVAGFASSPDGVVVAAKHGLINLQVEGDMLIGADGVRSMIRDRLSLMPDDRPIYSNRTAWRATIPADLVDAAFLVPESNLWLGSKAHLVHYPLRGGDVVNVVAIVEEKFRIEDNRDFWSTLGDAGYLLKYFANWDVRARRLLQAAPEWRKWPLFDRNPLPNWASGRIALLGDAAHPMLPFLAQGAAQAIEDAAALAKSLESRDSIEEALQAYSNARRERATKVQSQSRNQATIYHLSGPAAFIRDMGMKALGPEGMLARYDWLYATPHGAQGTTRADEDVSAS